MKNQETPPAREKTINRLQARITQVLELETHNLKIYYNHAPRSSSVLQQKKTVETNKMIKISGKKKNMKNNQMAPAGGLGYLGVSFCTPEGGGFNPPSEHVQEATDQCFSPSLSPPSPLHSYLHS